ncbi:MAG: hypothetical protein M1828_000428 [Chrysothrix sp. TS-e1954]|nr:MAG: hypothetical protein M1828_000428 [Chrysothrix sp. TS-e1954]
MRLLAASLGFAASATCLVARTDSCCFEIMASGGPGGHLGQLSDGQNRIGQGHSPAKYCLNNGALTDAHGRGCILTPPTTQFQCDEGATPTGGFSIGCHGTISQNGSSKFYACPTGDHGGYNVYTALISGEPGCVPISLTSDACFAACPSSTYVPRPPPPPPSKAPQPPKQISPPVPSTSCVTPVAPPKPISPPVQSTSCVTPVAPPKPSSCPTQLTTKWEFPHLIMPVDSSCPDKVYANSLNGTVTGTIQSVFNFDIPLSTAGMDCSLVFLFPQKSKLQTSSFSFSGPGLFEFDMLAKPIVEGQAYQDLAPVYKDYGVTKMAPGNSYVIDTFKCPADQRIGFRMGASANTKLSYFQDFNPSPIGLYITVC